MKNDYKKIQEKIKKAVVKHLNSVMTSTLELLNISKLNCNIIRE